MEKDGGNSLTSSLASEGLQHCVEEFTVVGASFSHLSAPVSGHTSHSYESLCVQEEENGRGLWIVCCGAGVHETSCSCANQLGKRLTRAQRRLTADF